MMKAIKSLILSGLLTLLLCPLVFADGVPKLVDVGADQCIPCIKMAPILDALKTEFAGQMEVIFVDAWKNREEAARYGVQMIPTQIFFAADGQELFRHSGFYGREAILAKWRELGYTLESKP